MPSSFKIDNQQLAVLLAGPSGPVWGLMARTGNQIQNAAKDLCPVDRGRLRQSIRYEVRREGNNPTVVVGTNVQYAIYIHEGTGIHGPRKTPIRPVNKKFLAWKMRNTSGSKSRYVRKRGKNNKGKIQYVFAKEVQGIRPRPFLLNALKFVLRIS